MDTVQLERELTDWAAGVLGLTVDSGIYRGGIPAGIAEGVGVMLTGEVISVSLHVPEFNVQVLGKFTGDDARDKALAMAAKLSAALPRYGLELENFRVAALLPRGNAEPYQAESDGVAAIHASFNLTASVLTTEPPATETSNH
ncbi:hypothetical protein [Victivallis vadensis]|uniref:hypothetical protein n=1 Tax=Victivallis vadensis TaxID=172901 RepID=UPI003D092874